jgi:cytochrome P450
MKPIICSTGKDMVRPLGTPVKSTNGQSIHEILLKKNTNIVIGIAAANRDREIWGDDAAMWKPERWIGHQEYARERLPGVYSGM